ncbi:hypothetical protein SmJEL517_g05906 [Synchytrium microbalum]|uniref:Uncharacterized protein n=1 Tax=Synchytrium microbalum TaxID=1806994 RepID=A0A507BLI1_9FUNG|nr:uncharacterized protein SmJEL517_g05906 [Synchytrium microbalum]TPX30567.1 hypothetical protein SmJEL517_g05906 [Synchytrium microbalum]
MTGSWVPREDYLHLTPYGPDLTYHWGPLSPMWRQWAKQQPMLPILYHQIPNVFWLLTSSLALVYFMRTYRIMPRRPTLTLMKAPLLAKVMWLHHITHTLFYIMELLVTDMYNLYTPMFFHHIAASSLMTLCMIEPAILCVVYVMPFFIHGIFWVRGASEFDLLTVYNYSLLIAGVWGTYDAAKLRVVTPTIPVICLALSSVNVFTYCWSYQGYYCPPPMLPLDRKAELTIGLILWFLVLVSGCTYIGRRHRKNDVDIDLDFNTLPTMGDIRIHRTSSSSSWNILHSLRMWTTRWRHAVSSPSPKYSRINGLEANNSSNGAGEAVINMSTMWEASPQDLGRSGFFINTEHPRKNV